MAYDAKFLMVHPYTNCFSPTREWGVLGKDYFIFDGSKLGFELFLIFIQ